MNSYSRTHLADRALLTQTRDRVSRQYLDTAELLAAATGKTNAEIQVLLARLEPSAELELVMTQRTDGGAESELAVQQVGSLDSQRVTGQFSGPANRAAEHVAPRSKRIELRLEISPEAYEELRYAKEMLGHAVPSGEIGEVFRRAVRALIEKLEKRRFAATSRMSTRRGRSLGRYVPADVRRAVVQRDGGQCTYVSETGHPCGSRMQLGFDHVTPVAQGGRSTVDGIRLLCRAHNQHAAEQKLGQRFIQARRELAQRHRGEARSHRNAVDARARLRHSALVAPPAPVSPEDDDVVKALRTLGFKPTEAHAAASVACEARPGGSVEARLRHALQRLAPRCERRPARAAPPDPVVHFIAHRA